MTDAELNLLEHFAESQDDAITVKLITELRQTRAERNWLARTFGKMLDRECPPNRRRWSTECIKMPCEECWLDAAKETTSCQKN